MSYDPFAQIFEQNVSLISEDFAKTSAFDIKASVLMRENPN
ncbi:hypothetical protein SX4_2136 [Vibrio mimicus SX-4]|nr:hypothetical protein SX4_2136 [Vibrio mimicus SX-4]